jgi:hypothetical protein
MTKYFINKAHIIADIENEKKFEQEKKTYSIRKKIYGTKSNHWAKHTNILLSLDTKYSNIKIDGIFCKEYDDLISRLKNFFNEITLWETHPSGLYSVLNALSYRDLIILAKIESLFPIFENTIDDIESAGYSKKPYRDHFIHTSCSLHAGLELLKLECKESTEKEKVYVYSKLFGFLLESIQNNELYRTFPKGLLNKLMKFDLTEKKIFIRDLWIVISLMHDIGYLPIIDLHFKNISEIDLSEKTIKNFIKFLNLEQKRKNIISYYEKCGISFGSLLNNVLPTLDFCATNTDGNIDLDNYITDPQKSHGVISGYFTLKNLVEDKKISENLNPFEKFFALIACSSSISHVIKTFKIDKLENWKINPMGAFLKLVDIAQEWLRITWVFDNNKSVKDIFNHCQINHHIHQDNKPSKYGNLDGLTMFIGQSPIKGASFKIMNDEIQLKYHKYTCHDNLYICEADNRPYNYNLMLYGPSGVSEKQTELPQGLKILTGYDCREDCIGFN